METSDWPAVMQANRGWLSSVVFARVRDREAVEEVLQETALAASKQVNFDNDNNGVFRWLYRVAIRQAILYLRRKTRSDRRIHEAGKLNDSSTANRAIAENPLRILIATENQQLVHQAMENLGAKDREILMLKYYDGWSCSDAAERLGVSASAIKSRLLRARRNLRVELLRLDENW